MVFRRALQWAPLAAALLLAVLPQAEAQTTAAQVMPGSYAAPGDPGCSATSPVGCFIPYSVANPLPVSASVSASISGFTAASTGTPISVTTGGVTGSLPAGAVVVATNVGATNGAYCKLGASATTSDQYLSPGGGWFAFTVLANTQLTCITSTSTTTVNMVGGAGLPTGTGGGGGASGAVNVSQFGGNNVVTGTGAGGNGIPRVTLSNDSSLTGLAAGVTTSGTTGSGVMGAVTTAAPTYTTGQTNFVSLDLFGGLRLSGPYPAGATAITASATGTTGATTATLAGTSGKTTFICGYSIRANATAAATVTNTITGVITATLSSIMWVAPLASGIGVDEQIFEPCIPASGTNQAIAIVSGAPGSGGTVSSKGWGYQQ